MWVKLKVRAQTVGQVTTLGCFVLYLQLNKWARNTSDVRRETAVVLHIQDPHAGNRKHVHM